MTKFLLAVILCTITGLPLLAQSDTLVKHYAKDLREVPADSAFYSMKLVKKNDKWLGIETYSKTGKLKSEGLYADAEAKNPLGTFKNFKEDGSLFNIANYVNGKLSTIDYFYKSGNKMSMISYQEDGKTEQKGWDEAGKEIKNFVVEREAIFKGGPEGWRKYLAKKLNPNVAADAGAPAGQYDVRVQFVVNKEGYITNVKAISAPSACKPCASEAVNVISGGPEWVPAIQNNVPVNYNAIQIVSFVVEEGKGKKKG